MAAEPLKRPFPFLRFVACRATLLVVAMAACSERGDENEPAPRAAETVITPTPAPTPSTAEPTPSEPTSDEQDTRPCRVQWQDGPQLAIAYTENGGTVELDADGDGKPELCQQFTHEAEAPDAPRRIVSITFGACGAEAPDAELTAAQRPKAPSANLAFFDYKAKGAKNAKPLTLVLVPGVTGLLPGYPLYADVGQIQLEVTEGRVISARAKRPWEGSPVRVTFAYDEQGRVTQVDEDRAADGKIDQTFVYRYEGERLVGIGSSGITGGGGLQAAQATVSYSC